MTHSSHIPARKPWPGALCLIISGKRQSQQCTAIELKPKGFRFISLTRRQTMELTFPCWAVEIQDGTPALIEEEKLLPISGPPEGEEIQYQLPAPLETDHA